jgi:leucyl-tRNA synthetase
MPVTMYTGGAEHATMHLLYARFFTKAIRDIGIVDFDEPFSRLFNQGTVIYRGEKMSKSKGNVVTPDTYVGELGADAVRVYLMFVGPWEQGGEWNDNGIIGMHRWLTRVWNLVTADYSEKSCSADALREFNRYTHQTIRKVTTDMERFHFNTMLAALMEFTNYLGKVYEQGTVSKTAWDEAIVTLLLLLAPSTPHLSEELWVAMGRPYSIHNQPWPKWDVELAKEEEITLVIQINGKLRDKLTVPVSITEEEAKTLAIGRDKIQAHIGGKTTLKVVYVPRRLVNIVVKDGNI